MTNHNRKRTTFLLGIIVLSFLYLPNLSAAQAQPTIEAPTLDPVILQVDDGILILTWSDIAFHVQANRTFYEVRTWLSDPQHSYGNYYPEESQINVSLSKYPDPGLYHAAVRGVEQSIEILPNGEENITQEIRSDWSNVETFTINPVPIDYSNSWRGANWEKIQVTPGLTKTIIYSKNIHFLDTTSGSWLKTDFRDRGTFYLARNSELGVRFQNLYTEIFEVESNITKVGSERWRLQALIGGSWSYINLINTQRTFIHTSNWINLTRIQDIEYNSNIYGQMNTTLSMGEGIAKYTINILASRNATIRLVWEFSTIEATKVNYLLNLEDINDKLINASKLTFYDETDFTLRMNWIDAMDKFQYCRVFKQADEVFARAFFGNWTISPGISIVLDPSLTTVTTPSDEGFISYEEGGGYHRTVFMLKFDISSIDGTLSKANFVYWGQMQDTAGQFNGNASVSRINNQTWSDSYTVGNLTNMYMDQQTNTFNTTGLDGGTYPEEWEYRQNTVSITDLIDQDIGTNDNFTISFEDPDYFIPSDWTVANMSGGSYGWGRFKTGGQNWQADACYIKTSEDTSYYHPKLEIYLEAEGIISETGVTVNFSIQPESIIYNHPPFVNMFGQSGSYYRYNPGHAWINDGQANHLRFINPGRAIAQLQFDIAYPLLVKNLNYDTLIAGSALAQHTLTISNIDGVEDTIYSVGGTTTQTGTHSLSVENVLGGGKIFVTHGFSESSTGNYDIYHDLMTIDFNAHEETRTLTRQLFDNKMYEYFDWTALAYNDTLTITDIPTTYTLAKLEGVGNYTDTISADGTLIITNTTKQTYRVYFDTGSTVHKLHMAHSYPDGLGSWATWDEVRWFLNSSQIEHNDYTLFSGYYELEIFDYFDQLIKSSTINYTTSDAYLQRFEIELPIYLVGISNLDSVAYNVTFSSGGVTGAETLVPEAGQSFVRLYGTESGVEYTVDIWDRFYGSLKDSKPLNQTLDPNSLSLNYRNDLWDAFQGGAIRQYLTLPNIFGGGMAIFFGLLFVGQVYNAYQTRSLSKTQRISELKKELREKQLNWSALYPHEQEAYLRDYKLKQGDLK